MANGYTNLGNIEGIYVVHAKTGYELHENRLTDIFNQINFPIEFVTDGDPSCFTDELLNKYFCPEIKSRMSAGVISCTLNHILSYERMVKNQNKMAIVFENDPFFLGDFVQNIRDISNEAAHLDSGFLISLENTTLKFPKHSKIKKGKLLYEENKGRCAGAYIIDLKAATNILNDLKTQKCTAVIDWWHNTLISRNIIKMYWAHPPIIEQGSHNGLMCSTISSKEKSFVRQIQWQLQKFYKTNFTRFFN